MAPTSKRSTTPAKNRREPLSAGELFFDLLLFVVTVGLLCFLKFQIAPSMSALTYSAPDFGTETRKLPAFFDSIGETFDATLTIRIPRLHPSLFAVQVDDCIQTLSVNGKPVIPDDLPVLCSPHSFSRLNLRPYLKTGDNSLTFTISDIGVTGGINMLTSNMDPLLLMLQGALFFCIVWFAFRIRAFLPRSSRLPIGVFLLLLFAILLRLTYANATSYTLRSHDTEGHVDYIAYVSEHLQIPNAADGWEYHQPPLYYGLSALWRRAALSFGAEDGVVLQSLSGVSVALSVLTVLFMLLIGMQLIASQRMLIGYAALCVTACGLLLLTPNITNEALALCLTTLLLYLLLRWWAGKRVPVTVLALVFSLAFVTKISAILLLPVVLASLLLHPNLSFRRRLATCVIFCSMTAFLAGWYPSYRLFIEPSRQKTMTLGNDGMDVGLMVPRDTKYLVTFSPIQMLRHPFNNPWEDEERRGYFLEYFFRSALFGEFDFEQTKPLALPLLALALLLLIPMLLGAVVSVHRCFVELWPLHLSTLSLLGGAFLYPYFFPFSPNQDFRFSVLLTVPAAYYTVYGIAVMPKALRILFSILLALFTALCAVFYGSLFFLS